jgi:hypothetical protein
MDIKDINKASFNKKPRKFLNRSVVGIKNVDVDLYRITPRDETLIRDLRYLLQENQTQFWQRFGVTQSRGSRFERGMAIPLPVLLLIRLYLTRIVTDEHLLQMRSLGDENGELIAT